MSMMKQPSVQAVSENQSMTSRDIRISGQLFESPKLRRKNLTFAIIVTLLQISFCLIYGFLYSTPAEAINVSSIVTMIFLAILVIAGFGLVFGYTRQLAWSGIGFNFFIAVFCIIYYPLINNFWVRVPIQKSSIPLDFSWANRFYTLVLAQRDSLPSGTLTNYGNTLTNSLKAALAMVAAFSSILGRAGQIECLVVCIVGVIGFELNRQIVQQAIGSDAFGTMIIFTFGGFMGLVLGIFCYLREQRDHYRINEISLRKYSGEEHTVLFSLLGALIIFVTFPFLAYDIDIFIFQNSFAPYTSTILLAIAMAAGIIGSASISLLINGYIVPRDVTHGLIAGAVIAGSGTHYIFNVVFAIVTGFTGGAIQGLIQNLNERACIRGGYIISTVSWSMFGVQGILGAVLSAGWKKLANNRYPTNFTPLVREDHGEQFQIYNMLVSAGMGVGFGIIAGIIIFFTNFQGNVEYFDDGYYWRNSDSIRFLVKTRPHAPMPTNEVRSDSVFLEFEEGNEEEVNNKHAYL